LNYNQNQFLVRSDNKEISMPDCKQYGGITRDELLNLRNDLADEGIIIPEGDDVEIQGPYGIKLSATYNERKETLKICITEKPFYIPESAVWNIVDTGTAPYAGD
jgi:hypothetical protein